MNTVTLIGNLTKDPELREHEDTKICDLRLAESNGHKDSPLYIDISAFGRQAEVCSKYLSKGRQVAVSGQLRYSEWKDEDGDRRSKHSILADRVDFLAAGKDRNSGNDGADKDS